MPSRAIPEKGQMAHFLAHCEGVGSLFISNPQVVNSNPTGQAVFAQVTGLRAASSSPGPL